MPFDKNKITQLKKYFASQPIEVAYLFGSQATGKATKSSDADIGILFKKQLNKSQRFDLRIKIIAEVCGILKMKKVDIIDLEEAPIALKYSAVYPRKEIYTKNNNRRVIFEAETNSRYFDYAYFIKKNTLNSLASIARMK